jgi:hypothetical protein
MSSMTITPIEVAHHPDARLTVRLTRRGRLVVFLASLLLVLAAAVVLFGGASVATDEAGTPEPTRIEMVNDGETLWDIAAGLAGEGGTREMMSRIERLNALDSGMVYAGQRLRVPTD